MVLEDVRSTNFEVPLQVKSILFFHLKIYNCYKERKEKQKPKKETKKLIGCGSLFIVFYKYTFNTSNVGFKGPKRFIWRKADVRGI